MELPNQAWKFKEVNDVFATIKGISFLRQSRASTLQAGKQVSSQPTKQSEKDICRSINS
jgi:hypothetical protein